MFDVTIPGATKGSTKRKRKIPKSHRPAIWKAVCGLGWIAGFMKFSGWYKAEFVLGDGFLGYSVPRR